MRSFAPSAAPQRPARNSTESDRPTIAPGQWSYREMYRKLRLCSQSGAYEAVPDPPRTLDLARVRHVLEREGIAVVDARVMLIVGLDPEVTISRNGRLLFKTRDSAAAERAFERLQSVLTTSSGDGRTTNPR